MAGSWRGPGGGGLKIPDGATGAITGYAEEDFAKNDLMFGKPGKVGQDFNLTPVPSNPNYTGQAFATTTDGQYLYTFTHDTTYANLVHIYKYNGSSFDEISYTVEPEIVTYADFIRTGQIFAIGASTTYIYLIYLGSAGYVYGVRIDAAAGTTSNIARTYLSADFNNSDSSINVWRRPNGYVYVSTGAGSDADTGVDLGFCYTTSGTSFTSDYTINGYSTNHYPHNAGIYDEISGRFWVFGAKAISSGELQIAYFIGSAGSSYSSFDIINVIRGGIIALSDGTYNYGLAISTNGLTVIRQAIGATSWSLVANDIATTLPGSITTQSSGAIYHNGYFFLSIAGRLFYATDPTTTTWIEIDLTAWTNLGTHISSRFAIYDDRVLLAVMYTDATTAEEVQQIFEVVEAPSFSSTQDVDHTLIGLGQADTTTGSLFNVVVLN